MSDSHRSLVTHPDPDEVAPFWYVVHTKPRQEAVALEQLQRQAFEVYLPLFRVFRKPARARKAPPSAGALTTSEPMFPRYLFLRPTRPTQSLSVVRSTVGVTRLVVFGQQPASLADQAVQTIRRAEALRNAASLDQLGTYRPGMSVRILDPAFEGVEALVQAVSRDRVTLLLEILGRPQSVQVDFGRVAPV